MNRYEIARASHKFDSCEEAFTTIGLEYLNSNYACYNEEFAANDTCQSKELPQPVFQGQDAAVQPYSKQSYSKILDSLVDDDTADMF